jgi:uncharacterized HAD superfamily protein
VKHGLLLVDIDQVVCDFVTPFCEWGNRMLGKDVSPADVDCYDMFKLFDIPEADSGRMLMAFFASGTEIPAVPGAVEGMKQLATRYRIWYVTARPRTANGVTVQWLNERGIAHRVIHCSSDGKVRAVNSLVTRGTNVTGMIEDNPAAALEAADSWPVWLLDYPYNREAEHPNVTRVKDWSALVASIMGSQEDPRLTMSEEEYAHARFADALRTYLKATLGQDTEVGYVQVVGDDYDPGTGEYGRCTLEVDLKVVN